jgi:hypothetical protein
MILSFSQGRERVAQELTELGMVEPPEALRNISAYTAAGFPHAAAEFAICRNGRLGSCFNDPSSKFVRQPPTFEIAEIRRAHARADSMNRAARRTSHVAPRISHVAPRIPHVAHRTPHAAGARRAPHAAPRTRTLHLAPSTPHRIEVHA